MYPCIKVRVHHRPGHGYRVRIMVLETATRGFRAGQSDYNTMERVDQQVIPFWRVVAQRLAYRFELEVR